MIRSFRRPEGRVDVLRIHAREDWMMALAARPWISSSRLFDKIAALARRLEKNMAGEKVRRTGCPVAHGTPRIRTWTRG